MTWIRSPLFECGALGFWVALSGGLQSKIQGTQVKHGVFNHRIDRSYF